MKLPCGRVGATQRAHAPVAAFREVQPIAHLASDAVVVDPANVRLIDAALIDQVLDQTSHRIVSQRGNNRRVESEATFQSARDVVLAAAFPDAEALEWCEFGSSPGSSRSITSPSETQSQRQSFFGLIFSITILSSSRFRRRRFQPRHEQVNHRERDQISAPAMMKTR